MKVFVTLLTLMFYVGAARATESEATPATTLNYCTESGPLFLNPQLATDSATFNVTRNVYNRLLDFEHGGIKVVPSLAKSWKISEDGKEITFSLRKGVHWQKTEHFTPTRDFNADDVLFSFNRMRQGGSEFKYFHSMGINTLIRDLVKVDDNTVKFVLSRPDATIIANLAMDFASILSAEYAAQLAKTMKPAQVANRLDTFPVGTGPFIFIRYTKDKKVELKANPDYFDGAPKIDELIFHVVIAAEDRVEKLKSGECDIITNPMLSKLKELRRVPGLRVMSQAGLNVFYLAFNTKQKPFDDVRVRRAIHHAINRERIVKKVFDGHAQVAKNPIPPTMWSYDRHIQDLEYNVKKAKDLLKKAGIKPGFEIKLWYMTESRPYNPNGHAAALLMKQDLENVGLKVKLVTKKWTDYLQDAYDRKYELIQLGWTGDNGDPDNFLNTLLSCTAAEGGNNYSGWCNKRYTHYVERARVAQTIRKRTQFYEEAQKLFKREVPWVTIAHATVYKAMSKRVEGYKMSPFGFDEFFPLRLKPKKVDAKKAAQ